MNTVHSKTLKRWLAASCIALALPLSAQAFPGGPEGRGEACDGRMGHGSRHASKAMMGDGMPLMHQLRRLDLSEAQQDKVFEVMHQRMPEMRTQMRELQKNEQALRDLRQAPDFNEAQARTLIDQISRQRADMEMSRLQSERRVLDLLTPEQRQTLAERPASKPGKAPPRS
ncbi:MAG: Spy/CpxP family protein refolding chaperone [Dechloromonas sp.]|nr:Spy/CpxP family protein refolding chaperone [Dechloromonas sp.]